jgi:hypothetical protein
LARSTPVKVTGGRAAAAPPAVVSEPVRVIESSHRVGLVPSPVVGKCWASAQESTLTYAVPFHCCVVMDVSRTVDQNVGPVTWHALAAVQLSANGTSSQFTAVVDPSGPQPVTKHRSPVPNTIWSGALAEYALPAVKP